MVVTKRESTVHAERVYTIPIPDSTSDGGFDAGKSVSPGCDLKAGEQICVRGPARSSSPHPTGDAFEDLQKTPGSGDLDHASGGRKAQRG